MKDNSTKFFENYIIMVDACLFKTFFNFTILEVVIIILENKIKKKYLWFKYYHILPSKSVSEVLLVGMLVVTAKETLLDGAGVDWDFPRNVNIIILNEQKL